MPVVVTGATGNVGHVAVEALGASPEVTSVLGLARRRPAAAWRPAKTTFSVADITSDDLTRYFVGADAASANSSGRKDETRSSAGSDPTR
jgi:nucleoside-diphosphate-sugar epimerase